jgi:hypothetical protein
MALAAALALFGCGGSSINGGGAIKTNPSDPTIFGINETAYNTLTTTADETTSFADASGNPIATGAQDSTASAIFQIADGVGSAGNSTIALGFPAGAGTGNASTTSYGEAMTPGQTVSFGAYIANGQNSTGGLAPVKSVSLTSSDPEWNLGALPLSFSASSFTGALADDDYATATFTSPFTTSGVHTVVASVTDSATTTNTTFNTIVLNPSDNIGCVVAQAIVNYTFTGHNSPTAVEVSPYFAASYYNGSGADPFVPAQATITGEVATANPYIPDVAEAQSAFGLPSVTAAAGMTDQNGVAVVFASPGTQTLTITGIDPVTGETATGTATVTVTAGKITSTTGSGSTLAPLQVVLTDTGAAVKAHAKMIVRRPLGGHV